LETMANGCKKMPFCTTRWVEKSTEKSIDQPMGFESKEKVGYDCKLRKTLYGLKQAPRVWCGNIAELFRAATVLLEQIPIFLSKSMEIN